MRALPSDRAGLGAGGKNGGTPGEGLQGYNNVAVEQELAGSYQIQGTPTLVMFLNQNEVGRVEGPSPTVSSVLAAVTQPFQS